MSQLTDKLKRDHKALAEAIEEIKKLGPAHPEFSKKLNAAKLALVAHVKHEETDLYPSLKKAGETDIKVKSTLKILASDMETVTAGVLGFFAKYEKGGDPAEFTREVVRIQMNIATRIRREEESLYPLFDNSGSKAA